MTQHDGQSMAIDKSPVPFFIKALVFSLPQLGLAVLIAPIAILAGLYAKYFGLSLVSVAGVILVAKLFDAVTDPLIGYWSDCLYEKTGSRKALIIVGGLLLIPCSGFLYVPLFTGSVLYFFFWYLLFYFSLTLISIPYMAWANEFTFDTREKTMTFGTMNVMGLLGGVLFYSLPILPYFVTNEITPLILKVCFLLGSALILLGLYFAIKYVPSGRYKNDKFHHLSKSDPEYFSSDHLHKKAAIHLKEIGSVVVHNKPFLVIMCVLLMAGVGMGMWFSLFFTYVDSYLGQGEVFTKVYAWGMAAGALMTPVWYHLVLHLGKRTVWLLSTAMIGVVFVSGAFLSAGIAGFSAIFTLKLIFSISASAGGVISGPLLCDVIDYSQLKEGVDRSGVYFSLQGLFAKIPMAVGAGLGLAVIGLMGYDATSQSQTELALFGMRVGVAWLPAMFMLLSMVLIAKLPLNERRMVIIRKRLAQHQNTLAAK